MMPKLTIAVLFLTLMAGTALAQTTDLMITEYVEGSGNNKALEITNGTLDVINLGGYSLERYANGTTVPTVIALNPVGLAPGASYVIANPLAAPTLLALADQTDTRINFNGNDAIVLSFGGNTVIDSFGRVGEDPGTGWSCIAGTTANHTLRRLSSICFGDTNTGDVFNPCNEWSFAPIDIFSGLRNHIADCGTVPNATNSWGGMKAIFR